MSEFLSAFFSAGVPNGEFPEILIAKCRSTFYCTWFFSRAEDFESWREGRKGPSKSGFLSAYVIMSLHYVSVSRFLSAYVIVLHGFLYVQLFEVKHRCLVFRYIGGIADHHCLNFLWKLTGGTEGTLKIGRTIFCWGEILREEKVCAEDKALTRETPAKRGRVTGKLGHGD
jgi:hypothetical protein